MKGPIYFAVEVKVTGRNCNLTRMSATRSLLIKPELKEYHSWGALFIKLPFPFRFTFFSANARFKR